MLSNRERLQSDFFLFLMYVMPEGSKTGKWLLDVCRFLSQQVHPSFLKGKRPVVTLGAPVQHGKSTILRHYLCWLVGNHPQLRYNFYTASDKLMNETCLAIDMILNSPHYIDVFGKRKDANKLQDNSEGFQIFDNKGKQAGRVDFRLMGAGNIGHPSHVSIIDDPYRNKEEAMSETMREKIESRFRADIISRRQERSMVIIMHSRWHLDDLIGYVKENLSNVLSFSSAAISEDGKALFPELRSIEFLNEQRKIMNEDEFMALYQQNPIVAGGNLFKRDMFHIGEICKEFDYVFITADTAYKEKANNDFTVFSCWGVNNLQISLVDIMRDKIKSSDIESRSIPFIRKHTQYGFRGAYIEPKGHGIYLNQKLPTMGIVMPGDTDVAEFFKDRKHDKVMRANNVIPYMTGKKIIINQDLPCAKDLIEEVISFPKAKHDDFTDTLIDAIKFTYCRGLSILDVL